MTNPNHEDHDEALRRLDRALRTVAVPDLEPVDVGSITSQRRLPSLSLPAWIPAVAAITGLLLVGHLVGLDMRWGTVVTMKAAWVLAEGLIRDGPYGLGGVAEKVLWLAGLALAGCGFAGAIIATVVERVEPQGMGGRSKCTSG